MVHWVIGAIGVLIILIILALVFAIKLARQKKKHEPDYYLFFILGIVWMGAGVPLMITTRNFGLFVMGIVFLVLGITNKDKWKKNHRSFNQMSKSERKWFVIFMVILGLLVIAGAITFLFVEKGLL